MIDLYNKLQIINHNIYEENTKYLEFVMTTKPFIILWSEVDYLIFENCSICDPQSTQVCNTVKLQIYIPNNPVINFRVFVDDYVKNLNKCLNKIYTNDSTFQNGQLLLETEIRKQKLKRLCD